MNDRFVIILAAGKGTRMKSKLYKVLHPVCGKPMVDYVLTQVEALSPEKVVTIVGEGHEQIESVLGDRSDYAVQEEQLGTGHAVLQAEDLLKEKTGTTLVISGDTPLFTKETLDKLFSFHEEQKAQVTVLTAKTSEPFGYGRVIRGADGQVDKIVEQKDTNEQEALVEEINTGVYCFDNQTLFQRLHEVGNNNAQSEYYLPDVVEIIKKVGGKIAAYQMDNFDESMGVNDRVALSRTQAMMQRRINEQHMRNGVTIVDPTNTYIDIDVEIGSDTVVEPNTKIFGKTTIGSNCLIGSGSRIEDSQIGNNIKIISSTIEESKMADGSNCGPNSHLRPATELGEDVHIGNFCELKNVQVGPRTKIGHLTYVGDATLGSDINVGCGVVFVNFDGVQKFHSEIGSHTFIGSNSNIVSPVKVSDHAFIAAGSTITDDVPYHAMAIARQRQTNKEDFWQRLSVSDSEEWNK
ncbi:bifunctional UDP-N-acetylglucosamine diphosphorylase/glucosamine-1-phosphate N-acetyltransferase GlmU [Lactobacillus sp. YT155]|uniref:bifunctional UDP-N-acetylglucosamine diphosphorylase/glucosamine-1-phosphate N-acetyltransferase GlmU n=1 Tax=Lactobacillus sp. YT155 TaxID=3060955 RepID=UPI002660291F|nr:bifunctional UDP-N-acetylglucosamine diphosphorylase/glucosamine-1-phosphate N-acetyltransferase GlmU [Lactobacillus sp. YT155]MDO1604616.1 bifunctional UDP-N-acetylglucosamine diphosphorylase/glucosamine-1-phosphate N-acetyltransferase GlmU [Lactobacillus sp. YT155]